jgi:RNA polymerase sigma factor (sigma-70 family)
MINGLLRDLAPQVLGVMVRRTRDFADAEDAVQEALLAAAESWPRLGVPDNPRGWLIQVAARKRTDAIRSDVARRHREEIIAAETPPEAPDEERDDTLELLFLCCHPALSTSSAIALTLRAVGGLTTAEIARAFLVPEATMAQRISRAKQTMKGAPFEPGPLGAVLYVLYLMFNEGYTASSGDELRRGDLCAEAIRLTRAVRALRPGDGEVAGLLALMLLTDARRAARTGPAGELIPLDEQDRSRWDRAEITEGTALLGTAISVGSEFQVLAAIAALHDEAPRVEDTDWPQILALYDVLAGLSASPMVALNQAVAVAMVHGPTAGLERLEAVGERLAGHHRLLAVRAHLLERAGQREAAIASYQAAANRTASTPERDYLLLRAIRLRG